MGIAGSAAAEHDVLAGRFEVVVLDEVGPGPVPAADRLRVLADALAVRDVRVADRHVRGVERDAALLPDQRIAMHVDVIENDVMRNLTSEFCALEPSPSWMMSPRPPWFAGELDVADVPVMGARRRPQRRRTRSPTAGAPAAARATGDAHAAPGSTVSGAALRRVIQASPVFVGSTKLPTNSAPSWSRIVSPGWAAFSAC